MKTTQPFACALTERPRRRRRSCIWIVIHPSEYERFRNCIRHECFPPTYSEWIEVQGHHQRVASGCRKEDVTVHFDEFLLFCDTLEASPSSDMLMAYAHVAKSKRRP